MGGIGLPEVLIFVAIIVLFFGASKIPELAKGIGQGMNEFKKATNEELDDNSTNEKNKNSDSEESKKTRTE
jgi:sec-independent protein translocase protein TatA